MYVICDTIVLLILLAFIVGRYKLFEKIGLCSRVSLIPVIGTYKLYITIMKKNKFNNILKHFILTFSILCIIFSLILFISLLIVFFFSFFKLFDLIGIHNNIFSFAISIINNFKIIVSYIIVALKYVFPFSLVSYLFFGYYLARKFHKSKCVSIFFSIIFIFEIIIFGFDKSKL